MKWRPLIRSLHRDVGYFMSALVAIYSLSGLAVNHIDEWNPSYAIEQRSVDVGPLDATSLGAMQTQVIERLEIDPDLVQGHHREAADRFVVFLSEGGAVSIAPSSGQGHLKLVTPRSPLFEFNVLHLNHMKGAWTWFADAAAVLLFLLALSGLFMIGGRKGLMGRGKWFVLAGVLVPVIFVAMYHASQ